jgi:CheY-like chemotaxis protein
MSLLTALARPLSVLVVDDLVDAADSLAAVLVLCGFAARVATSGRAALAAALADPPDAVVLDLAMPGMDGYELARRLRACPGERRPLLVAVTGLTREEDRRRSAEAGIDLHFLKPVEPAALVGVLERFGQARVATAGTATGSRRGQTQAGP